MYDRISDIKLKRTDTTLDLSQKAVEWISKTLTVGDREDVPKRAGEKRRRRGKVGRWWPFI
jgi:hypothetical protein